MKISSTYFVPKFKLHQTENISYRLFLLLEKNNKQFGILHINFLSSYQDLATHVG